MTNPKEAIEWYERKRVEARAMVDRDCVHCKHRKADGCSRWDCEYEPRMDDLISRADAIDVIMGEPTDAHYPSWYADKIKALPTRITEYTTFCGVPIEKAAKIVQEYKADPLCALADRTCPFQGKEFAWCLTCPHISEEDRELARKAVDGSQPKTGWIPVSERLPENSGCVLISIAGDIEFGAYDRQNSDWAIWRDGYWDEGKRADAWMPLPEPYREDGEEE